MPDYSFSQSAHSHFCIRCNVYSGPVVIDSADICGSSSYFTETSWLALHKRKQATILCTILCHCLRKWQTALYHYIASLNDANSARVNSLDIEEEAIEELFEFTRLVVCGDKVSRTMGTAQAAKWKAMKKKSFIRLRPGG